MLLAVAWFTGCREPQPVAPVTGTYGAITNAFATSLAPARPDRSTERTWTNAELAVIQSELSPATLLHSTSRTLSLFANQPASGIGAPTFLAIETQQGPKIFRPGDVIDPARMRDSWFVVWWAGATNWVHWDAPWFLTLQRRPQQIQFSTNGLHLTFPAQAGYAALMPLYGEYKPLPAGHESSPFALLKEKKKRVLTWEWFKALPADPLARAMYWASALKEYPIYVSDSFSLDREHDSVVLRQQVRFLSWDDDWNTRHVKLAPVSPVLALALREGFPARFSKKPDDMEIFTSHGPLYGIEGVDEYTVTLPVLRFVNETAGVGDPVVGWSNAPCFQAWQNAHGRGAWDVARPRWQSLWSSFRTNSSGSWLAFGPYSDSPLDDAANAMGAARLAYRFGDADAYAEASHLFAGALIQLCAQQRGVQYFRVHQPWQSMEPMGPNATLAGMTADGWNLAERAAPIELARAPDVERLWREARPLVKGQPVKAAVPTERLIPGGAVTPFVPGSERRRAGPESFPAQRVENEGWPRFTWPNWKTPTGEAWSFGEVKTSSAPSLPSRTNVLNWNTRVVLYSADR